MSLKEHLFAVADELQRLKAEGVVSISVEEATIEALRKLSTHEPPRGREVRPDPIAAARSPRPAGTPPKTRDSSKSVHSAGQQNAPESKPPPKELTLPGGDKRAQFDWLVAHLTSHPECVRHVRSGKKAVVGVGNLDASIMFVGEAPGAEEEIQGEPFVGPAGQLLNRMIRAMGLERSDVYIGNIMNWRPQIPTPDGSDQIGNRPPTAEEMAFCLPFLRAQIAVVRPRVIVALGATAAKGLLGADAVPTLGSVKGRWHDFGGTPLMITYHPSYLLRNNSNRAKRSVWEDLLIVMERVGLAVTARQRGFFL